MGNDYDKEEVYEKEIAPLLDAIVKICNDHKIPMLASFQTIVEGDGTSYTTRDTTNLFTEDRVIGSSLMSMAVVSEEVRTNDMVIPIKGSC